MKIHIKATNAEYIHQPFYSPNKIPFPHPELLGVHEYPTLEKCIESLMQVFPNDEFIVFKENGMWGVEIYNDYRE